MKITTLSADGQKPTFHLELEDDEMRALVASILAKHKEGGVRVSLLVGMLDPELFNRGLALYEKEHPEDTKPGPAFCLWVALKLIQAHKNIKPTN